MAPIVRMPLHFKIVRNLLEPNLTMLNQFVKCVFVKKVMGIVLAESI